MAADLAGEEKIAVRCGAAFDSGKPRFFRSLRSRASFRPPGGGIMSQAVACCPRCGKSHRIEERHLGRTVRCRKCSGSFTIAGSERVRGIGRRQRTANTAPPTPGRRGKAPLPGEARRAAPPIAGPPGGDRFKILAKLGAGAFGTVLQGPRHAIGPSGGPEDPPAGRLGSEDDAQRFLRRPARPAICGIPISYRSTTPARSAIPISLPAALLKAERWPTIWRKRKSSPSGKPPC